jgi:hypothetical protein
MKTFFIACILLSAYAASLDNIFDEVTSHSHTLTFLGFFNK